MHAASTRVVDTALGSLMLHGDDEFLTGIELPTLARDRAERNHSDAMALDAAAAQLNEYFAGERFSFDVPLRLDGTDFQRTVWRELSKIPFGETITYRELAHRVGSPKAFRAVGQANGKNPIPIIVPCHRVVASDGIGGYAGGVTMKHALLEFERARSQHAT
ncbi:MAG: methylated-DNA--[protein]-cysteine S-methyltransferase [Acidimicrobiales bacterium]